MRSPLGDGLINPRSCDAPIGKRWWGVNPPIQKCFTVRQYRIESILVHLEVHGVLEGFSVANFHPSTKEYDS
jgi:hypothetical protein